MIEVQDTEVEGCYLITRKKRFQDHRGLFEELWSDKDFFEADVIWDWHQDNLSFSKAEVIRGLHIQRNRPQGKLVTCLQGKIWDVCVDLRPNSPTFKKWTARVLDHKNGQSLMLPPGTAHGFAVLSSRGALVHYKCTSPHDPASDGGIIYGDRTLMIPWPIYKPILSDKDLALPTLVDYLNREK